MNRPRIALENAKAFLADTAERAPPLHAKIGPYANRGGKLASFEIDLIRADLATAESGITRATQLVEALEAGTLDIIAERRRTGCTDLDTDPLDVAVDEVNAAIRQWRGIEQAMRGFIASAW